MPLSDFHLPERVKERALSRLNMLCTQLLPTPEASEPCSTLLGDSSGSGAGNPYEDTNCDFPPWIPQYPVQVWRICDRYPLRFIWRKTSKSYISNIIHKRDKSPWKWKHLKRNKVHVHHIGSFRKEAMKDVHSMLILVNKLRD